MTMDTMMDMTMGITTMTSLLTADTDTTTDITTAIETLTIGDTTLSGVMVTPLTVMACGIRGTVDDSADLAGM